MIKKIFILSSLCLVVGVSAQKTHTVSKGDTPYNIAKKYGMTLDELIKKNPKIKDGKLLSIVVNGNEIGCEALVLAIGHSSRDTFKKVYENGLLLEPKNFSVGVRIEHLQEMIIIPTTHVYY